MLKQVINRYSYVGLVLVNGSVLNAFDKVGLFFMSNAVSYTSYKEEELIVYFKTHISTQTDFELENEQVYIENTKLLNFISKKAKKHKKNIKNSAKTGVIHIPTKGETFCKALFREHILKNKIELLTEDRIWNNKYVSSKIFNISRHSISNIFFNI